jgi:hypothetical protein
MHTEKQTESYMQESSLFSYACKYNESMIFHKTIFQRLHLVLSYVNKYL